MNERPASPAPDTIRNQLGAGDPASSVWVSANAGSGKTHILVERVLRLLLSGVAPENILCLTYTRAGAAEMAQRVAGRLSEWAVLDEVELRAALAALCGQVPVPDDLVRARTLFAHALETPGGLKILTIHAFCEAALHRFPLEAEVPVGFSVIEGSEQEDMLRTARERVLAEGLGGNENVAAAVAFLFANLSDDQIERAVNSALSQGRQLKQVLANPEQARANLKKLLEIPQNQTIADLEQQAIAKTLFGQQSAERVFSLTPPDENKSRFEDKLARIDWQNVDIESLFKAFLKQDGTLPKKGLPKKEIVKADPELAELITREAERLAKISIAIKHLRIARRSAALLDVLAAINKRYEIAKQAQGRLDYYDLITRFESLISQEEDAEWVRYKLDSGLTHILVDESQDTNPDQWNVVTKLVEEFFAGQGAVERERSIFAVGDEKQSIYSFQGADPVLFAQTGSLLRRKALDAGKPWKKISFRASFRTLENILEAIDKVSKRPGISRALLWPGDPEPHESARTDKGGMLTLWPPVRNQSDSARETGWPVDPLEQNKTAPRQLAERIARQIFEWVEKKRPLARRKRPVSPDDILILVQSRGDLFEEIIRALKKSGLPTPGADRLPVSDHIVVRDLLTLGDVLLTPDDDLSLATLLRSPLFSLSESQLETLCINRGKRVSLWRALNAKAKSQEFAQIALDEIVSWRNSLDFDRPYEFFAQILFASGGLKRFHQRLGEEIDDVIGEFMDLALAHEQSAQPSLRGFLASMREREILIKREFSASGGVRIMTVHGAKGLEAPIVILADAATCTTKSKPVFVEGGPNPMLVHIGADPNHSELSAKKLGQPEKDAQMAEYWRKLYVAMTRAEDELYVTGYLNKTGKLEGTWYEAIKDALEGECCTAKIFGEDEPGLRFPGEIPGPLEIKSAAQNNQDELVMPLPGPLAPFVEIETVRPSHSGGRIIDTDAIAPQGVNEEQAKHEGIALHALLQYLASVEPEQREKIAFKAIKELLPDQPFEQKRLASKALAIFKGPDAPLLFGSNSRAELAFFLFGFKEDKPARLVGRIDRVIIKDGQVLVVDFKSNSSPPSNRDEVSMAYQMQLGLYLRVVQRLFPRLLPYAAIYWTQSETLMYLNNEQLLKTTRKFKFD